MNRARRQFLESSSLLAGVAAGLGSDVPADSQTAPVATPSSTFDPWLEINGASLRHNVQEISKRAAGRPILAVIKNNACDVATMWDWETGSRPEDVAAACGASVYDLTMHLNPLLPRRAV
jgi:hypothetical protein